MVWDGGPGARRASDVAQLTAGAALLSRAGNRVAALAVLWAAVAIAPTDQIAHRRLAATLANAGDLDGAAQEYVRYIEFLLPLGELSRVTAELHYAATTLGALPRATDGALPALVETTRRVAAQLPSLLERHREATSARAAVGAPSATASAVAVDAAAESLADGTVVHFPATRSGVRIPFNVCLHEDADIDWVHLEGGTPDLIPSKVRLIDDEVVVETRRCLAMPPGRASHVRNVGSGPGTVWVVIAAPPGMLGAIERGEGDRYRVEALIADDWLDTELTDTGCRAGSRTAATQRNDRSA